MNAVKKQVLYTVYHASVNLVYDYLDAAFGIELTCRVFNPCKFL